MQTATGGTTRSVISSVTASVNTVKTNARARSVLSTASSGLTSIQITAVSSTPHQQDNRDPFRAQCQQVAAQGAKPKVNRPVTIRYLSSYLTF